MKGLADTRGSFQAGAVDHTRRWSIGLAIFHDTTCFPGDSAMSASRIYLDSRGGPLTSSGSEVGRWCELRRVVDFIILLSSVREASSFVSMARTGEICTASLLRI